MGTLYSASARSGPTSNRNVEMRVCTLKMSADDADHITTGYVRWQTEGQVSRTFIRAKCLATHVLKCQENLVARADKQTNKPLRPASEIAQDRVHSAASLCIGKGNELKGQDNRELFFPKPLHMYDAPDGFVLPKEGYARKGVAGAQARQGKFNFNQKAFLIEVFENAGSSHKIKDKDAHDLMRQRFSDKGTDDPFSFSLVLSSSQIKSW